MSRRPITVVIFSGFFLLGMLFIMTAGAVYVAWVMVKRGAFSAASDH